MSRRLMLRNASGGGGSLPPEYQQVEWIAGASRPYINLGRLTDNSVRVQCKAMCTNAGTYGRFAFAALHTNAIASSGIGLYISDRTTGILSFRSGSTVYGRVKVNAINKPFVGDFYISSGGVSNADWSYSVTIDNTEYSESGTAASKTYSDDDFCLFGNYIRNGELTFSGRFYYAKVWNGGVPFADLMPCYRKSDNVVGMYDFVTRSFLTTTTGAFTKGADV